MAFSDSTLSARFWPHVQKSAGCWLWTGYLNTKGYGRITINRETYQAHRLMWEVANGSIPAGVWVLHRCDNPTCVNPEHLFVTPENTYKKKKDGNRICKPCFLAYRKAWRAKRIVAGLKVRY